MNHQYISAHRLTLDKVFSDEYDYHIPYYQRPYSWKKHHAKELFKDLVEAVKGNDNSGYFLGCLILIKEPGDPKTDVVDGQQRLTTLTILLSLLAHRDSEMRERLMKLIIREEDIAHNRKRKPRLTLREQDKIFFRDYIQGLKIKELQKLHNNDLSDSQRRIVENANVLDELIKEMISSDSMPTLKNFASFLITDCYIVTVTTPKEHSALRLFEVLNTRGMDLQNSDVLKADVIQKINEDKRDIYSRRWEDIESTLGRERFKELFRHLYVIFFNERPRRKLVEKIRNEIDKATGEHFIDEILKPYAKAFELIVNGDFDHNSDKDENINDCLHWLNSVGNDDWIPPAIKFIAKHRDNLDDVAWYLERLERIAGVTHVTGRNMNYRTARYARLLTELNKPYDDVRALNEIKLDDEEHERALTSLKGDIYSKGKARRYKYIVQRLNAFMSDKREYFQKDVTIEHVMPQTISPKSQWAVDWPDADGHSKWVNKLANLMPLNKSKNSEASNKDFEEKKKAYTKGTSNISSFALTLKIFDDKHKKWDEATLIEWQKELIKVFKDNWGLVEPE